MVLACANCFICGGCECLCLTHGESGIEYLLEEGMPMKEVHCLTTQCLSRYLLSMENSRSLCYVTSSDGPLHVFSLLCVLGQVELKRELVPCLPFLF